ncbi:hypothetical protein PV11_07200 [Exophiala sideris]|uniref:Transcription factor domain-containing protein n=1 Tax=Exophiala sideris TaxID=1016849 RepID=A0A0D1Y9N2_9EURO|nr:hypothetical protein PV11_07200 [Exophiala sideris]
MDTGRKCDGYAVRGSPENDARAATTITLRSPTACAGMHGDRAIDTVDLTIEPLADAMESPSHSDRTAFDTSFDFASEVFRATTFDPDTWLTDVLQEHHTTSASSCGARDFALDTPNKDHKMARQNAAHGWSRGSLASRDFLQRPLSSRPGCSDLESYCFDHFQHVTAPQLVSYFDNCVWRRFVKRAALGHPVVRQAAIACGAAHRRYNLGISREAFEFCGHSLRTYTTALRCLKQMEREASPYDHDAMMTSWTLLGLFEGLQDNDERCVEKFDRALQLLRPPNLTLLHSESRPCEFLTRPNRFIVLLHRVSCRAIQLFGSSRHPLTYPDEGGVLPPLPDFFEDLEQAMDFLLTDVEWILNSSARLKENPEARTEAQSVHVKRLSDWSTAYMSTVQRLSCRTTKQKQACMLMKLLRNATYLLLYMVFFIQIDKYLPPLPPLDEDADRDPDQDQDLLLATRLLSKYCHKRLNPRENLSKINTLIEGILDDNGIFSNAACQNMSGDYTGGSQSPHNNNESASLVTPTGVSSSIISSSSNDSWELLGLYALAEKLSNIETRATLSAFSTLLPEALDRGYSDVVCLIESRRILLRYFRINEHDSSVCRVQEWWVF